MTATNEFGDGGGGGFVNFINEIGQNRNILINMFNAVQTQGIPRWIVEVRHAITHNHMPDLDKLREATKFCHQWLLRRFWQQDVGNAMNMGRSESPPTGLVSQEIAFESRFSKHLQQFKSWRDKNGHTVDLKKPLTWEIQQLCEDMAIQPERFFYTLTKPGFLILTPKQLKEAKIETSRDDSFTIPERVQLYWQPILVMIFDNKMTPEFLCAILNRLRNIDCCEKTRDQLLAIFREIAISYVNANIFNEEELTKVFDSMILVPTMIARSVFELFMEKMTSLSRKRRKQILKMLDISNMGVEEPPTTQDESFYTVEDIQNLLKKDRLARTQNSSSRFELCDPNDWKYLPFGISPGQDVRTFSLLITDDILSKLNS
ncbi:unnamed protein product [Caenorhabditis bovis]|uniref:Uncharacterized protein n=1 Tax=Caenorhabditis bovis TaxID=2654633 RepID=A0A8S1FAL2_9PELO|nr:unnamed protein product [Caenorhabditis bovis]